MKIHRVFLICIFPSMLFAETVIKGIVRNKTGEPLPFANVFLEKTLDGATTNSDGSFEFSTNKKGTYTLSIRYIGYSDWKKVTSLKGKTIIIAAVLKETPIEMGGITVKASSFTTGEEEGVTLTPLEVLKTPGSAADICWAIKSYPGIQQFGDGAGLFVRGGEVTETMFLLDGAIVNHPYRYESPTGGFFGTFSSLFTKRDIFLLWGILCNLRECLIRCTCNEKPGSTPKTIN